jgi:hypothetical protein
MDGKGMVVGPDCALTGVMLVFEDDGFLEVAQKARAGVYYGEARRRHAWSKAVLWKKLG